MLTPTKVTFTIREITAILISSRGVHWPGERCVIEFDGTNITEATTKAVMFLEKVACPTQRSEWKLIQGTMCHWLRHKGDPRDTFRNSFSYASGTLWMLNLSIEEVFPCKLQQEPSQPTNTKSFADFFHRVWKKLFNN